MPSRIEAINRIYDTYAVTSKSRYIYVYDVSYDYARWSRNTLDYFDVEGEYIEHFVIRHTYYIPKCCAIDYLMSKHYRIFKKKLRHQIDVKKGGADK